MKNTFIFLLIYNFFLEMYAKVLRIHWHDKKPVYSQDFDPNNASRLVTAGGDNNIRVSLFAPF